MNHKMKTINIRSEMKNQMIDVTSSIQKLVEESHVENGLVTLFVPHTTAAITINENADLDVKRDILHGMNIISPNRSEYRHYEKNSDAHIKSSLVGVSLTIIIEDNQLVLGTWQGIYFCEFDGPRSRKLYAKVLSE